MNYDDFIDDCGIDDIILIYNIPLYYKVVNLAVVYDFWKDIGRVANDSKLF